MAGGAARGQAACPPAASTSPTRRSCRRRARPAPARPVHEFRLGTSGLARLVSPVPVRDGIGGLVSVIAPEAELDQVARLAVARAASACAIELDRERAVRSARDEMEGEFVESLLAGTYSSEDVVRQRAERLGFELDAGTAVLVARLDGAPDTSSRVRHQLLVAGQGWIRRRAPGALCTVRGGALAAAVTHQEPIEAAALRRPPAHLRLESARA